MIRKFAISFFSVLALPLSSYALVGGPFDGNDYSQALDNNGIYQTAYHMRNGSGFSQFGLNVPLTPAVNGSGGNASISNPRGTSLNRSLIYFQGVVYFGIASGTVDHDRGLVTCVTNGTSDANSSVAVSTAGGGAASSASATSPIVTNGARNYSANTVYEAKITKKAPILKFSGSGSLTVLAADNSALISQLAQTILATANATVAGSSLQPPAQIVVPTNFVQVITIPGTPPVVQTTTFARPITDVIADQQAVFDFNARNQPTLLASQVASANAVLAASVANVEALRPLMTPNPANADEQSISVKIRVFGSRKFF